MVRVFYCPCRFGGIVSYAKDFERKTLVCPEILFAGIHPGYQNQLFDAPLDALLVLRQVLLAHAHENTPKNDANQRRAAFIMLTRCATVFNI